MAKGIGRTPTNHSKTLVEQLYEQFWTAYPRKMGKKEGLRAWKMISPGEILFMTIMSALEASKHWWQLNKVATRYIPYPANWLKGEHWLNVIPSNIENKPKHNRFHNFSQRQHGPAYYAELDRLERQYLLDKLNDGEAE